MDLIYPAYPEGTARRLLATDLVTPKTREVLNARIAAYEKPDAPRPRFFTSAEFRTLQAVCARLIPQTDRERPIDLAVAIDDRLAAGKTKGWRYDSLPPDAEAFRRALCGLNETARTAAEGGAKRAENGANRGVGTWFETLDPCAQDAVLAAVQRGDTAGPAWGAVPSARFFEELLTELVECYYSHPLAQDEIGFAGYADAHGWQRIGLDELESFEPRPVVEPPGDESVVMEIHARIAVDAAANDDHHER